MRRSAELPYRTANDLPKQVRLQIAELLNQRLSDALDLDANAKQAHWNVKGTVFIALHKLFDEIHTAVEGYVDLLAERVVQLGGIADGTTRMTAQRSSLVPYPENLTSASEHCAALATSLAEFGSAMRSTITTATEAGDHGSADICTEISRGVDKWLWFVEAHSQNRLKMTTTGSLSVNGATQ